VFKKLSFLVLTLSLFIACGSDDEVRSASSTPNVTTGTEPTVAARPLHYLNGNRCFSTETNLEVDSLFCPSPTDYVAVDGVCYETVNNTPVASGFCAQVPPNQGNNFFWINGSCYDDRGFQVSPSLCPASRLYYWSGGQCVSGSGQVVGNSLCPAATSFHWIGSTCYGLPGNQIVASSLCPSATSYYNGPGGQCFSSPGNQIVDRSLCPAPLTYSLRDNICFSSTNIIVNRSFCGEVGTGTSNNGPGVCNGYFHNFSTQTSTLVPVFCNFALNSCQGMLLFNTFGQQVQCQ